MNACQKIWVVTGNPEVITVANRATTGIETAPSKTRPGRHARTLDFSASLSRNLAFPETLDFGTKGLFLIYRKNKNPFQ
jgi:hypothetical protein